MDSSIKRVNIPKEKYLKVVFNNGRELYVTDLKEAKEVEEFFQDSPSINKRNAYIWVNNRLVFLENVDELVFQTK